MSFYNNNVLLGVATSAHQIEGNNTNSDWWFVEQNLPTTYVSGKAANSWDDNFETDLKNLIELNVNSYRFSIEWSRIHTSKKTFNVENLNKYINFIQRLKKNNITPLVTLHHFTNPQWFEELGGWQKRSNVRHFIRYIHFIMSYIGEDVKYFITFNEPNVFITAKYIQGTWHPYTVENNTFRSLASYRKISYNIIKAHKEIYKIIKIHSPKSYVSICPQYQLINGVSLLDKILSFRIRHLSNFFFYDKLKKYLDFITVNIYTESLLEFNLSTREVKTIPEPRKVGFMRDYKLPTIRLLTIMKELHKRYKKPIMITEHGTPNGDIERTNIIKGFFDLLPLIKKSEIKFMGYFHWSLVDNFEWHLGYDESFGLYKLNSTTLERKPKNSAITFSELTAKFIETNSQT